MDTHDLKSLVIPLVAAVGLTIAGCWWLFIWASLGIEADHPRCQMSTPLVVAQVFSKGIRCGELLTLNYERTS
jgi:hypothetical protein